MFLDCEGGQGKIYMANMQHYQTETHEPFREKTNSVDSVFKNILTDYGLTPFSTIVQSYHGGQFTYSCISWLSNTSTYSTQHTFKATGCLPRLANR